MNEKLSNYRIYRMGMNGGIAVDKTASESLVNPVLFSFEFIGHKKIGSIVAQRPAIIALGLSNEEIIEWLTGKLLGNAKECVWSVQWSDIFATTCYSHRSGTTIRPIDFIKHEETYRITDMCPEEAWSHTQQVGRNVYRYIDHQTGMESKKEAYYMTEQRVLGVMKRNDKGDMEGYILDTQYPVPSTGIFQEATNWMTWDDFKRAIEIKDLMADQAAKIETSDKQNDEDLEEFGDLKRELHFIKWGKN